jgi:hypothetical protein
MRCNIFLSMMYALKWDLIGVTPKSKLASPNTFFWVRQDHSQLILLSLLNTDLKMCYTFFCQERPDARWLPLHSMLMSATMSYLFGPDIR